VPVGTGDEVERIVREANPAADFAVVSNPEFLREGAAIADFTRPDRIVVGAPDERARAVMAEIYRPLTEAGAPIHFASRRSAELIKYAANAFLAMKVSFINEIADLAEAVGANVGDVARGIGADQRIGARYLNAGAGFGGSCLPKDTAALIRTAEEHGRSLRLIAATRQVNAGRRAAMMQKIADAVGSLSGKRIGVLGLSFAPNTDDLRDAPALGIIADLLAAGASVAVHDPAAIPAARGLLAAVDFAIDPYALAEGADALVLVTEWADYKMLDLTRLGAAMRNRVFVDLRNALRGRDFAPHGFRYRSVGRPDEDVD
jgi:UDPglucose 6-dehydrogenase